MKRKFEKKKIAVVKSFSRCSHFKPLNSQKCKKMFISVYLGHMQYIRRMTKVLHKQKHGICSQGMGEKNIEDFVYAHNGNCFYFVFLFEIF